MMTQQEFGQAILECISRVTGKCFIDKVYISKLKPYGFDVALGYSEPNTRIHIMGQFNEEDFLKYFEKELKSKRLHYDQYFEVRREYPEQKLQCCYDSGRIN